MECGGNTTEHDVSAYWMKPIRLALYLRAGLVGVVQKSGLDPPYPNHAISATWNHSPATPKKLIMNTFPRRGTLSVRVCTTV